MGADVIFAFQLRNPIHNGHALLIKVWKITNKVQSEKKETKVDAHISVNFSHLFANFVSLKMVIFIAFQRGPTHYCDLIM